VAEQQFGTQAGRIDALFGVVFGHPVQELLYGPILHWQIIAGAQKSEKQKELAESALSLKLGLFGFVWVCFGFVFINYPI
jgi:hypothetical protein